VYVTKTNFAYEHIRDAILTGKYPLNQKLILKELSQDLDISPMPVREALNHLEKDGLVKKIPYQGSTVSPLSLEEMEELFELRIVLETFALKSALARIEEKSLEKLFDPTREMERYIEEHETQAEQPHPLNPGTKKFMSINRELHLVLFLCVFFPPLVTFIPKMFGYY
jgi:DNA-binding GntR family transcriptional regulator